LDHPQLWAWLGRTVWQGRIVALVKIVARHDVLGKQTKLPSGTPALALQSPFRKARFLRSNLCDRFCACVYLICNRVQEYRSIGSACLAVSPERLFCRLYGSIDMGRGPH
jgi:hypothetical protein